MQNKAITKINAVESVLKPRQDTKFNVWEYYIEIIDDSNGHTHHFRRFKGSQRKILYRRRKSKADRWSITKALVHLTTFHPKIFAINMSGKAKLERKKGKRVTTI